MIQWRDDVDFKEVVVEALVQNGLSVRTDTQHTGRRMVVREGNTVRVKYLPKKIELLHKRFFAKNHLVSSGVVGNKKLRKKNEHKKRDVYKDRNPLHTWAVFDAAACVLPVGADVAAGALPVGADVAAGALKKSL